LKVGHIHDRPIVVFIDVRHFRSDGGFEQLDQLAALVGVMMVLQSYSVPLIAARDPSAPRRDQIALRILRRVVLPRTDGERRVSAIGEHRMWLVGPILDMMRMGVAQ
jgi:hypothetical protein